MEQQQQQQQQEISAFADFDLDPRLKQAVAKLGLQKPTLIQCKAIPLALDGKDILARARTGSGKTLAYCLPAMHALLSAKTNNSGSSSSSKLALILVPTRELAEQVASVVRDLSAYCSKDIKYVNLATDAKLAMQLPLLTARPDIIVSTPARILAHLQSNAGLSLAHLSHLVIDEADMILSFGYTDNIRDLVSYFPSTGMQTFLMSATLGSSGELAKLLTLNNPVTLQLDAAAASSSSAAGATGDASTSSLLRQFVVRVASDRDKFLLALFIFRLRLIKGKVIVFVNSIDRGFRLRLFLEQFAVRSCVLNAELPLNSRMHIVHEFNRGMYDILIATDEFDVQPEEEDHDDDDGDVAADEEQPQEASDTVAAPQQEHGGDVVQVEQGITDHLDDDDDDNNDDDVAMETLSEVGAHEDNDEKEEEGEEEDAEAEAEKEIAAIRLARLKKIVPKAKKSKQHDAEFGVSRGIDFQRVVAVINFDFAPTLRAYTHRVGRTARGGRQGMALSLVLEKPGKAYDMKHTQCELPVYLKVAKKQQEMQTPLKPFNFDMSQVEAFRYRAEDALRNIAKSAIREARIKEVKKELLNSAKLQAYFEDNPSELSFLRHDKPSNVMRVKDHLKNIPGYLMPADAAGGAGPAARRGKDRRHNIGYVPYSVDTRRSKRKEKAKPKAGNAKSKSKSKKGGSDPLKSFRL
ncbi:ATP-dependent DNA/RNA helicase [Sorochytrium milnesiophthora]